MTHARPVRAFHVLFLALAAISLASGCNRDRPADTAVGEDAGDASLPRPEAGAGSVTGMPGARADGRTAAPTLDPATDPFDLSGVEGDGFDEEGNPLPAGDMVAQAAGDAGADPRAGDGLPPPSEEAVAPPPAPAADREPGADDAAAVIRKYYGAIDARQYEQAYQLWSGDGRASGQSASSFAGGFGDTAGVTVQTGAPGRVEGAAGSRYVRVPVAIRAVQVDGSERRYEGSYTLRRAVVDGASADQREWRIASADLREVGP